MKAQISFVEFVTTITIFLAAATYVSFQISTFIPTYLNEIRAERLRAEAYQLSELLINDPGEPLNWYNNFNNAVRIGLSDDTKNKTNLLSGIKISAFNQSCSNNYLELKKKLSLDYDFSLNLTDINENRDKIVCVPSPSVLRPNKITIRRTVAYEEGGEIKYGGLILQVW